MFKITAMHLVCCYNLLAEEVFEMCHLLWWIGQGGNFYSLFGPKNTNLVEDVKILLPVKFAEFRSAVSEKKSKYVSANQRPGRPSCLWISPKITNLVENVENLLSVKFRWIPFSGFIGEVENVSANQRTGRLSCFSDQPEKRKPGRGCWDMTSCQVLLNSIQRFQRKSWKCLSKS